MLFSLALFACFLNTICGDPFPAPTPAARHEKRQQAVIGVATIWSPTTVDSTLTYVVSTRNGASTVANASSNWNWCSLDATTTCTMFTDCQAGTISWLGGAELCDSSYPVCGTEYLYSTTGAVDRLTRPACFPTNLTSTETLFIVSPVPQTSTPTPSPTPSHSTPIGAIVGGAVGGVVVIGATALIITLLLCRRRRRPTPVQPVLNPAHLNETPKQPLHSPGPSYDSKHTSFMSGYPSVPNSPPPMFQHSAAQGQPTYPPQNLSPNQSPVSPPDGYPRDATPPVGPGLPGRWYAQQQGNAQPPAFAIQHEMPGA